MAPAARTSTRTGAAGDAPAGGAYLDVGVRAWSRIQLPLVSTWSALWSSRPGSPWLAVTALGTAIAVAGAFRLPRWQHKKLNGEAVMLA